MRLHCRMMEGKMVELSQLLGLFTGKLMEQQDQVGEIFEAAASANVNVEQARAICMRRSGVDC